MANDVIAKKEFDVTISEARKVIENVVQLSRYSTALEKPFKTIDSAKMNEIIERSQEINEKIYIFSKSDTQTTRKLMTLTMLFPADSVYRQLQQIAAQIERKQQALVENKAKLHEDQLEIKRMKQQLEEETDELKRAELEIQIQKKAVSITNALSYVEAAIKEIGSLLDAYDQIKKNKNIPDDWDELDVEREEVRTHIKSAFRNGLRDMICHRALGMGTLEYFEQMGISPVEAEIEVNKYIQECNVKLQQGEAPADYEDMYAWLNRMADKYKDNYKKVAKAIGLDPDNMISYKYLLLSERNKKEADE